MELWGLNIKYIFIKYIKYYILSFFNFLKRMYLFIYLFSEGKGGRERNTNRWLPLTRPSLVIWPTTQACALTRN